jgi:hypothetical protein
VSENPQHKIMGRLFPYVYLITDKGITLNESSGSFKENLSSENNANEKVKGKWC